MGAVYDLIVCVEGMIEFSCKDVMGLVPDVIFSPINLLIHSYPYHYLLGKLCN